MQKRTKTFAKTHRHLQNIVKIYEKFEEIQENFAKILGNLCTKSRFLFKVREILWNFEYKTFNKKKSREKFEKTLSPNFHKNSWKIPKIRKFCITNRVTSTFKIISYELPINSFAVETWLRRLDIIWIRYTVKCKNLSF